MDTGHMEPVVETFYVATSIVGVRVAESGVRLVHCTSDLY